MIGDTGAAGGLDQPKFEDVGIAQAGEIADDMDDMDDNRREYIYYSKMDWCCNEPQRNVFL